MTEETITKEDVGAFDDVLEEQAIENLHLSKEVVKDEQQLTEKTQEDLDQEEIKRLVDQCIVATVQKCAEIAARLPAHVSKSPRQHGTDISGAIMDLLKK